MKDSKIVEGLYPYFRILNKINKNLTSLIKVRNNNRSYDNQEKFYYITSELTRLLPYKEKDNMLVLDYKSGILLLWKSNKNIENYYSLIINNESYNKTLKNVLKIRNKFIHEPHNISCGFHQKTPSIYSIGVYYKTDLLYVSTISLAPIIYYINKVFEEIINDLKIEKNKYKNNYLYNRLLRYNFKKWKYTIVPEYLMLDFHKITGNNWKD